MQRTEGAGDEPLGSCRDRAGTVRRSGTRPRRHRRLGGTGVVAGTLAYDGTVPAYTQACRRGLGYALALDSPAFVLRTPDGPQVAPLSIRGRWDGVGDCVSEASASGALDVSIDAGELHCDVPAAFVRFGAVMQLVAGGLTCRWGGGTAPGNNWVFTLGYEDGTLAGNLAWAP